jgi:exodeoxyribonuclease VII large subunit
MTVSELSGAIKRALEDGFGYVRLRGEVSGYRGPHSSGHAYFGLKDDKAKIDAVIWKGNFQRLRFKPEEGMEVIAQGRITTFPGSSKYQIVIEALEPAGAGALMAILEERKRKLAAEGLFAAERKRKLPFWPAVVGIITSPTGAVIRDMLHGFDERFPAHVVVWPVRVQGEGSAAEVAAAIRGFNRIEPGGRIPRPDVLIVARGGGSLEDLWGFNEEIVVRAAAESAIPLISAVGHETDWTLIDLVADARAPTPTKAAEWAVPMFADLVEETEKLEMRLRTAVRRCVEGHRTHLKAAARGLPRPEDLVAMPRQRFDSVDRRLGRALLANTRAHGMRHAKLAARLQPRLLEIRIARAADRLEALARRSGDGLARLTAHRRTRLERLTGRLTPELVRGRMSRAAERVETLAERARRALENGVSARRRALDGTSGLLRSLSYQSVLGRGFALVRDSAGQAVRSIRQVKAGAVVSVEVADGRFAAQALEGGTSSEPKTLKAAQPAATPSPPRKREGGGGSQGSLF